MSSVESVSSDSSSDPVSEPEKQVGDLNGREVEVQEHKENAKEHLGEFVKESIQAGLVVAAHPGVGLIVAPKMIYDASNHLIEGCKEYNEAKRIENEAQEQSSSGLDHEPDRDSWDREY